MDDIIQYFKDALAAHWPFFTMAMILGTLGQIFKQRVWTLENAKKSRVIWWIRAFLPFHAPMVGAGVGLVCWLIFKEATPISPGISGVGYVMMYYAGAGIASAWVFNGVKHFAESRGLKVPSELDEEDSMRPQQLAPPTPQEPVDAITPMDPPMRRP